MKLVSSRRVAVRLEPGLGDVVAGAAKAVGIRQKPGCGCARRQQTLNRATPAWLRGVLKLLPGVAKQAASR